MGVSVPVAQLGFVLIVIVACAWATAFGLTVEPFETDVEPVDSAEKNRAEQLSTAEPIDLGGNTDDPGPQTFGPPVATAEEDDDDDELDYDTVNDDEFESRDGNGGEIATGGEIGLGHAPGSADGITYEEEPGHARESGYGLVDGPGYEGEAGLTDGPGYGEEPEDVGETGSTEDETGSQWGREVVDGDAAYEGSNDLRKAASIEVSASPSLGARNDNNSISGNHSAKGYAVHEKISVKSESLPSPARNGTFFGSANERDVNGGSAVKGVSWPSPAGNETGGSANEKEHAGNPKVGTKSEGRRRNITRGSGKMDHSWSSTKVNQARNASRVVEPKLGGESKVNISMVENGSGFGDKSNKTGGKSRVARGGLEEKHYWNGYKTYVNVNRTRPITNATSVQMGSENSNDNSSDLNRDGRNARENSEVKALVVEVSQNLTTDVMGRSMRECRESTSGNCTENHTKPENQAAGSLAANDGNSTVPNRARPRPQKGKHGSGVDGPKPGGLVQAESNKRSYNYDETQVPPPGDDVVHEIITYDYGDITEIIIPENSPPAPIQPPTSATLRYGLHTETNPYTYDDQPYYDSNSNGYPRYKPENPMQTTIPARNSLPTYPYYNSPATSPYPTSASFENYGTDHTLNTNYEPTLKPTSDPNFAYAPGYNRNLTRDHKSYAPPPRPPTNPASISKSGLNPSHDPTVGHKFRGIVNSQYDHYAPHYGTGPGPHYDGPNPHTKHSSSNPQAGPQQSHHQSGPVYEFYGTPKSKTWVSYESIPIKNPSTDAGPPIVEIIYHRENGVVYEDDVFDDVTTSNPEDIPFVTSTPGNFPASGDFSTSHDFPTHGDERFFSSPQKSGKPKNSYPNDSKGQKRPVPGIFSPRPGSGVPRKNSTGSVRSRKKKPDINAALKRPEPPRSTAKLKDEDFPDDFPEGPGIRTSVTNSKKKTNLPLQDSELRKKAKAPHPDSQRNLKDDVFPVTPSFDISDGDFPIKSRTESKPKYGENAFDRTKSSDFISDDEGFLKDSKIPEFKGFPKQTKIPDFTEGDDEFPTEELAPDFDSNEDFSDKDQKEFEEAEKLINRAPKKLKSKTTSTENRGHQKTKPAQLNNPDPSTSERQRKENSEVSHQGENHDSGQKKAEGKKGEKGTKSEHEFSEGGKAHKTEAMETEGISKKGGKKKEGKDEGGYYKEKHKGEEGEKEITYHDEGKHAKGHSTKGKHEVHKKDEFSRKHSFFDEHHEGGKHEKEGGYEAAEEIEKGAQFHRGHKGKGFKDIHEGKKGRYKEGKRFQGEKVGDEAEGQHETGEHEEEYGKEVKEEKKQKKEFEL